MFADIMAKPKTPRKCAFYRIRHKQTGDDYIGISVNVRDRFKTHRRAALKGSIALPRFYRALAKHGSDAYTWEIITWAGSFEGACVLERWARALGMGTLNCTDGGEGTWGVERSPETCAKLSAALKGKKKSLEARANMSVAQRKRVLSPEALAAIAAGNIAHQTGKKKSPETRAKMSASMTGIKKPEGFGAAVSARLRGGKHTPEHCAKIAASCTGRKWTPEQRRKIEIYNENLRLAKEIQSK